MTFPYIFYPIRASISDSIVLLFIRDYYTYLFIYFCSNWMYATRPHIIYLIYQNSSLTYEHLQSSRFFQGRHILRGFLMADVSCNQTEVSCNHSQVLASTADSCYSSRYLRALQALASAYYRRGVLLMGDVNATRSTLRRFPPSSDP